MPSLPQAIVKEIEARGYRVHGYHDTINDSPGPVVVTATVQSTGEVFRVRSEDGDEYRALIKLASLVGVDVDVEVK